jgi:probable DNA repair protein
MTHLLEAAEAGATILTGNRRAARSLRLTYDRRQISRGLEAWRSPDILPWPALVTRLWEQLTAADSSLPSVLSAPQERTFWRDIIAGNGQAASSAAELAPLAKTAWKLLHEYPAEPKPDEMQATPDTAAFARWMAELRSQLQSKNCITQAELPAIVMHAIQAGRVTLPRQIVTVGFDEFTPQQQQMLTVLERRAVNVSHYSTQGDQCGPVATKAADPLVEMEFAARWARVQVERGAKTVGVIVPDPESCRADIERIFGIYLQAAAMLPGTAVPPAFHISLGRRLSEWPMINIALLLLQWLEGPLAIADIGVLVRSTFIASAEEEQWARARLDVELRRRGGSRLKMREVAEVAGRNGKPFYCRVLTQALIAKAARIDATQRRSAAEWAQSFSAGLGAFGWPSGKLSSDEFQCHARWLEMLNEFAALDRVCGSLTLSEALRTLNETANADAFAPEDTGAPVQIMGALEAAGSEFDALWMMRLDAERWPLKSHASPLLPLRLQRHLDMPGCTPARQAEFAHRVMQRLQGSVRTARDRAFVLSFATAEGERELRPSPVLAGLPFASAEEVAPASATWYSTIHPAREEFTADALPFVQREPLPASTLFRLQSACPFHAFAELRLHARELNEAEEGPGALQRGTVTHTLMQQLWSELQTQERLNSLSSPQLDDVVGRAVDAALKAHADDFPAGEMRQPLLDLERERLKNLIGEWLELEKARRPFSVVEIEQKDECTVAGIHLRLRRDRVDELPDGRTVILDYKTGNVAPHRWDGDRPDDPQLPLYAITNSAEKTLAAIVFAHLKAGNMGFAGLQAEDGILPKVQVAGQDREAMQIQIKQWKSVLTDLGEQFARGEPVVDPKNSEVCRNCELPALCRISELRHGREDES